MKKFLCVLLCVVFAVSCFCSCKDEDEYDLQYEVPTDTMFDALDYQDSESFLRCFATPVLSAYEKSDNYDEDIARTIYASICQTVGDEDIGLTHKVISKEELSNEEIYALGDGIAPRHKVKKAFRLKIRAIAFSRKNNSVSYSQEMTIVVGKLSGNWYICQSPVMEWNLIKDI